MLQILNIYTNSHLTLISLNLSRRFLLIVMFLSLALYIMDLNKLLIFQEFIKTIKETQLVEEKSITQQPKHVLDRFKPDVKKKKSTLWSVT